LIKLYLPNFKGLPFKKILNFLPKIQLIKKIEKINQKSLALKYVLYNEETQLNILKKNSDRNYWVCIDLKKVYTPNPILSYKLGFILKNFLKSKINFLFFYEASSTLEKQFIENIPPHLFLEHLSAYTNLKIEFLKETLKNNCLRYLFSLNLDQQQFNSLGLTINFLDFKGYSIF